MRYTLSMTDSYMDHLPSAAREKIRRRMRSEAEYERLRERVKGPEDLEKELGRAEALAEIHFALKSNPEHARELHANVLRDLQDKGSESVLEKGDLPPEIKKALENGKFTLSVESLPQKKEDALVVIPEGTVQEKLPVKPSFTEQYAGALRQSGTRGA